MKPIVCYINDPTDLNNLAGQGLFYSRLVRVIREEVPLYSSFWIYKLDSQEKDLKTIAIHDKYNRPIIIYSFCMGDVVYDTLDQFLTKTFKDSS